MNRLLSPEELESIQRQMNGEMEEAPSTMISISARECLLPLKGCNKQKLNDLINRMNDEIGRMEIRCITELNSVAYTAALTITTEMGYKVGGQQSCKKEPPWKIRIQQKIKKLQRNISQITAWIEGKLRNKDVKRRLHVAYKIKEGLDSHC